MAGNVRWGALTSTAWSETRPARPRVVPEARNRIEKLNRPNR